MDEKRELFAHGSTEIFGGCESYLTLEGIDESRARLETYADGDGLDGDLAVTFVLVADTSTGLLDATACQHIAEGYAILLVDDL